VPALEDWGVPDARIHFEAFGPAIHQAQKRGSAARAGSTGAAAGQAIVVTFAKSGKQFCRGSPAGQLLDFAEAHGIAVDSGCRAGGCGSCQTTHPHGRSGYQAKSRTLIPSRAACLLCVCTPKTSRDLEL
jgi:ferredoxin